MDYLKGAVTYLMDPHLVSSFQHYFGIRKTSYPEAPKICKRNGRVYDRDLSPIGHLSHKDSAQINEKIQGLQTEMDSIHLTQNGKSKTKSKHQRSESSVSAASISEDDTSGSDSASSSTRTKLKNFFFKSMAGDGEYTDSDAEVKNYIATKPFWHTLFLFGSGLGDELFYATFFPLWFWNIDGAVGRRATLVWLGIMYIGE